MTTEEKRSGALFYFRVPETGEKQDKLDFLSEMRLHNIEWLRLTPNAKHTWLRSDTEDEFSRFIPAARKKARLELKASPNVIFHSYSLGANTNRDAFVYDFRHDALTERMQQFVQDYNVQVSLYQQQQPKPNVDDFVDYGRIAWSSTLKQNLQRGRYASYIPQRIRCGLYRPFTKKYLYYDRVLVHRPGKFRKYFPTEDLETGNRIIWYKVGSDWPQYGLMTNRIPDLMPQGGSQCFPFYTYDEDGSNCRENITDWALDQFREQYNDQAIIKWDIFYYIYAMLHHPGYRERYAADLKRELPRIPFASDFRAFSRSGKQLADLHLNYETVKRYSLTWRATKQPIDYGVEKMRPGKKKQSEDGSYKVFDTLRYNDTLTARGIPAKAFAYRLGNRSAVEWVIDQYRIKTDKRSGITHDPNGYSDDPEYIVKLLERVITVSLETVDIVEKLAAQTFRRGQEDS